MTADLLRKAAALMRERATTAPVPPGPWETEFSDVIRTDVPFGNPGYLIAEVATTTEAMHVASWHPAVALAVADWLYAAWVRWEHDEQSLSARSVRAMSGGTNDPDPEALAVARAYLGEES